MIEIKPFAELPVEKTHLIERIKDIFFLSSSIKSFSSVEKKEAFFKRWCGDYLDYYPDQFFILFHNNVMLGYLSGCDNSIESLTRLNVPGHETFKDLFHSYPAHLHINFHPDARGKGLGSVLVNHYVDFLKLKSTRGLHLITSPDAANVNFYLRLNFTMTETRLFKESELLFMGRSLE